MSAASNLDGVRPELATGINDSQSVKTAERGGISGYDAGKRKRGESVIS